MTIKDLPYTMTASGRLQVSVDSLGLNLIVGVDNEEIFVSVLVELAKRVEVLEEK